MREASRQRSIRVPERVDAMLEDLVNEGIFRNCTEAIIEAIARLYEDLTRTELEVNLRLRLTTGDYNNLKRLTQLEGGTEEQWAERLLSLYAVHHARVIAAEAEEWDDIFRRKRALEERTEGLTELQRR